LFSSIISVPESEAVPSAGFLLPVKVPLASFVLTALYFDWLVLDLLGFDLQKVLAALFVVLGSVDLDLDQVPDLDVELLVLHLTAEVQGVV
jgi:hypothetical protein